MADAPLIPVLAAAAGIVLVRLGWGWSRAVAVAGWALAGAALVALAFAAGAWGIAAGTVAGMAVALGAVLHAGWRSPPRARRPSRAVPAVTIPLTAPDLVRRAAVFLLVVPGAFAAAEWLAFAAQAFAGGRGVGEADRFVLAFLLQPVAWAAIMTVQMTRAGPARMIAPPLLAAAAGAALWGLS